MRATLKTLIGTAAAVVCFAAALILAPTAVSAQDIGGIIRGLGVPVPYGGVYRGPPPRNTGPSTSTPRKDPSRDSDEEESDSSSKSSKNSDKNSSNKNTSDKNASDKSVNADNKTRRQLSNAKDDGPAPSSSPPPPAKADAPKATADDEPSFSPSR